MNPSLIVSVNPSFIVSVNQYLFASVSQSLIVSVNQFLIASVNQSLITSVNQSLIGPGSARSYKVGVVGNNWLVGNAVFSEMALRFFLIFCIKLGDYKGRKVIELDL